jgi:hypothetical protein
MRSISPVAFVAELPVATGCALPLVFSRRRCLAHLHGDTGPHFVRTCSCRRG